MVIELLDPFVQELIKKTYGLEDGKRIMLQELSRDYSVPGFEVSRYIGNIASCLHDELGKTYTFEQKPTKSDEFKEFLKQEFSLRLKG